LRPAPRLITAWIFFNARMEAIPFFRDLKAPPLNHPRFILTPLFHCNIGSLCDSLRPLLRPSGQFLDLGIAFTNDRIVFVSSLADKSTRHLEAETSGHGLMLYLQKDIVGPRRTILYAPFLSCRRRSHCNAASKSQVISRIHQLPCYAPQGPRKSSWTVSPACHNQVKKRESAVPTDTCLARFSLVILAFAPESLCASAILYPCCHSLPRWLPTRLLWSSSLSWFDSMKALVILLNSMNL
jgi:hypothetical protein